MQFITLLNAFSRVWVRAPATASYLRICHSDWFRDIMLSIHFGDGKTKTFFSQKIKTHTAKTEYFMKIIIIVTWLLFLF